MKRADIGDVAAVNKEIMQALQQSPDVISKVGNSYKKRFKVASRVDVPKTLGRDLETKRCDDASKEVRQKDKNGEVI